MQVTITQVDGKFINGRLYGAWVVRLLSSGQEVGRISEAVPGGACEVLTFGNGKHSRRYRVMPSLDEASKVAAAWAKRRFA